MSKGAARPGTLASAARENYPPAAVQQEIAGNVEKEKCFDAIAKRYFCANFGTMTKSEMDTLLFSFFYKSYRKYCAGGKKEPSDLEVAKLLGITPSRVSSLRLKADLMYPDEQPEDWRTVFCAALKKASYNAKTGKIIISLPDRLVYFEAKEAFERAGGQPEYTLTPNLMQIPPEHLFMLLLHLSGKDEAFAKEKMSEVLNSNHMSLDDMQGKTVVEKLSDLLKTKKKDIFCGVVSIAAAASVIPPVLAAGLNALSSLFREDAGK